MDFEIRLRRALSTAEAPELDEDTLERLARADALVASWGRALNLTGFSSAEERARRYFGEVIAALRWVPEVGLGVDIGSGGGSPALPLAILRPGVRWTLVEARRKRALFLEEAVGELGLGNARVRRARYEQTRWSEALDVVTMRGVRLAAGGMGKLLDELGPGGRYLWFSGEARLREGREALRRAGWNPVAGPHRLLERGGFLLVAEKPPGNSETCFT